MYVKGYISKALAYLNIKKEWEILLKKEWETGAKELLSSKDVMVILPTCMLHMHDLHFGERIIIINIVIKNVACDHFPDTAVDIARDIFTVQFTLW